MFLSSAFGALEYVEGEVLIQYRFLHGRQVKSAPPGQIRKTFDALSRSAGRSVQWVKDSNRTTEELVAQFSADPDVECVSPNYIKRISTPLRFPDDPQFAEQWGLHNTGQLVGGVSGVDDADIDFTEARRLMKDAPSSVVVAVIDTGVDYSHPDLADAMWVNSGEVAGNGLDDDGNGFVDDVHGYDFAGDDFIDSASGSTANDGPDSDPMDIDLHGTHVAGIVAATSDNKLGISGAGALKVMALKTSSDGEFITDGATISAMNYVLTMKARGIDVVAVNASYGGAGYNAVERSVIQQLANAGIVFCAAAGNDSSNNDPLPHYPSSYDLSSIISVAATDSSDGLSSFSNYGLTSVDLGAPGSSIYSCLPVHFDSSAQVRQGAQNYSGEGLSYSGITPSNGVSGILYDCGIGNPLDFPAGVAGNIALIERGVLYFSDKVSNAMDAGAVATIIYNREGESGAVLGNLYRPRGWIPSVGITRTDGLVLAGQVGQPVTVINSYNESTGYIHLDGTSMATPLVAGCIGVLAQHFPTETVSERISRLSSHVDAIPALASKCVTGGRINLARSLDSDADELPDWWEMQYAANLAAMDGTSDLDNDFVSDLGEYRTQTDPLNPTSRWKIESSAFSGESGVALRWPSHTDVHYRVLASDNIVYSPFLAVSEDIPATPPFNEWTAPLTNAPKLFYKVELLWD